MKVSDRLSTRIADVVVECVTDDVSVVEFLRCAAECWEETSRDKQREDAKRFTAAVRAAAQ